MQLLGFCLLCLIWGTTWLAIKTTVEGLSPFYGAGIRFIVAFVALFFFILLKGGVPLRIYKREFRLLTISAILMYAIDYGLIYWAEQYLSAGITSIFFATFSLFIAIWTNFFFRNERFQWHKFIGLLVGFSGILIVFFDQLIITNFNRIVILAATAVTIASASAAMSVVIVKKYLSKMNPFTLTFHQMWIGILFLFLFGFTFEDINNFEINLPVISAVIYLALLGTSFAFVLYYKLLQQMSAITLSLVIYITPIIALISDYLIFGEVISFRAVVGMLIIFTGVGITQVKIK